MQAHAVMESTIAQAAQANCLAARQEAGESDESIAGWVVAFFSFRKQIPPWLQKTE
jgi:hypothetical protein